MQGKFRHVFCTLVLLAGLASAGRAEPITGTGSLGSFDGSFLYTPTGTDSGTLDIVLNNTSPPANGGFLTAFAFNSPTDSIKVLSLTSSNSNFGLLGGPTFQDGISGSPFGNFDIGASTSSDWLGGGNPTTGIGVNGSATFSFALTGTGIGALTTQSFLSTLSSSPEGGGAQAFVARFRGFNPDGSDKVPGHPSDPTGGIQGGNAPEPGSLALAGAALLCLAG